MRIFLIFTLFCATAFSANLYSRESMKQELQFIANVFRTTYAPTEWKEKHLGWDLDAELQKAISVVEQKSDLTVKDYHRALAGFMRSTQDYHVGFGFHMTEKATLPITIKEAEGKYLIAWVDREQLPTETFPYTLGDEIVEFDGKPIQEVVDSVTAEIAMGVLETDKAMASLMLTARVASWAMTVPRGPVELKIMPQGKTETRSHQLIWHYTPEEVTFPESNFKVPFRAQAFSGRPAMPHNFVERIRNAEMMWPMFATLQSFGDQVAEEEKEDEKPKSPFRIAAKKSFVPQLGTVIWESDKEAQFHSYLYKNEKGKLVGYIRIPHYGGSLKRFEEFRDTVKRFVDTADAMVIDQINNPGGNLFYIYALQSVLSDQVMYTPKEHVKINPQWVKEAAETLEKLKDIKTNEEAQKLLGKEWGGYPISYQSVEFFKEFCRFILDEWHAKKTLTSANYLWGVDKINPHKDVNFTGPIVVLTNELDFSGGDFFPAILQDNKRATILGVRTAGAGGFVNGLEFPSAYGVSSISFTGSLAKRVNDKPIENLGVTPDIEYKLTVDDYRKGFAGYKKAINDAINSSLKK